MNNNVKKYVSGIRAGDRAALSRAITLVESTRAAHQEAARAIVDACLPEAGNSLRVGITGVPGAGKSTFIEALGTRLVEDGRRIAILTVDPTSERSGGSILGDKTRMDHLANSPNVFIRPSPTGGSPGGVARKTRESILLCEAAGFDLIFVETVGVGQAETTVHSMVDVFLLLALAGAGDDLQAVKRGVVEMADIIAISKADGTNKDAAQRAKSDYEKALRLFPASPTGWTAPVLTCSALTGEGIGAVWEKVQAYEQIAKDSNYFEENRRRQARHWMLQTMDRRLQDHFYQHEEVQKCLPELERQVVAGEISATAAAEQLLERYFDSVPLSQRERARERENI